MGKYTTTLAEIVAKYSNPLDPIDTKIESARTHIFDFTYPIYDATYKPVIETKILKKYYTRDICEETEDLWKFRLDTAMNEIMPYFNQLYSSATLVVNPLYNVDLATTRSTTGTDSGDVQKTGSTTGTYTDTENANSTFTKSDSEFINKTELDAHNNSTGTTTQTNGSTSKNLTDSVSENSSDTSTSNGTSSGTQNTSSLMKENDTPQSRVTSLNDGYLTKVNSNESESSDSATTNSNSSTTKTASVSKTTADVESNINTDVVTGQENYNRENSVDENKTITGLDTTIDTVSKTNTHDDSISDRTQSTITKTENYIDSIIGNQGISQSDLLIKFRETFLNIDKLVVDSLYELFILLY